MKENMNKIIIVFIIGVIAGIIAGEYFPLWGGFFMMGEPFSMARNSLARSHAFVFGIVALIGSFVYFNYINKKR